MTELGTAGTTLLFLTPRGGESIATVDTAGTATAYGGYLCSREVRLAGDITDEPLLLVSPARGLARRQQLAAYRQLDNEILAGLRLTSLVEATESGAYPDLLTQLVGYQPAGSDEFVLLRAFTGSAVSAYLGRLPGEDRVRFIDRLLLALRWLSAAGLAHRGLSPSTVRWTTDSRVLVTRLFTSALLGSPREAVGSAPWAAPEQRGSADGRGPVPPEPGGYEPGGYEPGGYEPGGYEPGGYEPGGTVSDRDDVWALARLAVTVVNGSHTSDPAELERLQLLDLFGDAFAAPEQRPTPVELLRRRGLADPLHRVTVENEGLRRGRERFDRLTGYRSSAASSEAPPEPVAVNAAVNVSSANQSRGWRWGRGGRR